MTIAPSPWDAAARYFEVARRATTPGELAKQIDPNTINTPALNLVDEAVMETLETPDGRLILTMAPQEGKSTRVSINTPIWCLQHRPELRIVGASYAQRLANRNGRQIRNTIMANPHLGMKIAADNGSASEWQLAGHRGGVLSVGVGAGLTGQPADILIIDDPIKDRKDADSIVHRDTVWDWWTDTGSTRLAPGAPVIVILTRWHVDDLAGRLLDAEDGDIWKVVNIPAQADHRPEQGETDVLGREPGEFMLSARRDSRTKKPRGTKQWEAIKVRSGERTWASLYQGRPSPASGDILKRGWWQEYTSELHLEREDGSCIVTEYDEMIQSWDMAFKDTDGSDFVVGQVWMRRGANAYLLDQVRGRMDFVATCTALKQLTAKWPQAILKIVEDKANGTAVIASLKNTVAGIVPEEPQGSKSARASAIAPLVQAGNVHLPAPKVAAWVGALIEEAATFPAGANDDQVDALSQALNRLILQPLLDMGDDVDEDEPDADPDGGISPY